MPAAHPEEFRRRAVELARLREKPIAAIAKDLGPIRRYPLRSRSGSGLLAPGSTFGRGTQQLLGRRKTRADKHGPHNRGTAHCHTTDIHTMTSPRGRL
jgi:hypothetical protein